MIRLVGSFTSHFFTDQIKQSVMTEIFLQFFIYFIFVEFKYSRFIWEYLTSWLLLLCFTCFKYLKNITAKKSWPHQNNSAHLASGENSLTFLHYI